MRFWVVFVYRCLVRHGLITPQRVAGGGPITSRAMSVADGHLRRVRLADGRQAKLVTGIDDHSRFACLLWWWRGQPQTGVRGAGVAMRRFGLPEAILTDMARCSRAASAPTGEVLFDRICRENGIRHLLTAPRSPTTTGKVERSTRPQARVPRRQGVRLHRAGPGRPRRVG